MDGMKHHLKYVKISKSCENFLSFRNLQNFEIFSKINVFPKFEFLVDLLDLSTLWDQFNDDVTVQEHLFRSFWAEKRLRGAVRVHSLSSAVMS